MNGTLTDRFAYSTSYRMEEPTWNDTRSTIGGKKPTLLSNGRSKTCYAKGLLDQTCFFLWMELPNMYGSYKHGQENEGHRTPDFNFGSRIGCGTSRVVMCWWSESGKVTFRNISKYVKIWNMFGFAWAQEVKMIPYGFPSGFHIGTVRHMLEQIQGMGSSLHGYWMMCIPCILSGSYLSSMVVIHLWL